MATAKPKRLSPQHRRFVAEYLVDLNASAAAVRAGYAARSAKVTACRLLTHTNLWAEVEKGLIAMQSRLEMTADDVRREFVKIAKDINTPVEARISALDKLAKVYGMYTSKIHVTGTLTLEDLLLAADRKPAELPVGTTH